MAHRSVHARSGRTPRRAAAEGGDLIELVGRYDARRDDLIPALGFRLVIITPALLASTSRGRLRRHQEDDLRAIDSLLAATCD